MAVTADGSALQVTVATGRAYLNGYSVDVQDAAETVTVQASSGSQRLDRVVLHLDEDTGITLIVKKGTTTSAPALTRAGKIYEISLARVRVRAGAGNIQQSDITDERNDASVCGAAGAAGIASLNRLGRVKIDTTNGLTISGDGTLGHDGFSRAMRIYARQSPARDTCIGYIDTDGGLWDNPNRYRSGTYKDIGISAPTRATYKLYHGFARYDEPINDDFGAYIHTYAYWYNNAITDLEISVTRQSTGGLLYKRTYHRNPYGELTYEDFLMANGYDVWDYMKLPSNWQNGEKITLKITSSPGNVYVELVNPNAEDRRVYIQHGPAQIADGDTADNQ